MSRTVSFRASEELDEFLEQEAERRMTTKSTVAQMLVAERVRQLREQRDDTSEAEDEPDTEGKPESGENGKGLGKSELPEVFEEFSDSWYEPRGKHPLAVECADGEVRYYQTVEGAAKRLRREFRGSDGDSEV